MNQSILIIGGGQAAASCAARLRKNLPDAEIAIIGEESSIPYQRPPLSKKYATGEMTLEQLHLRPADWYEQNNIKAHLSSRVSSVNRDARTVTLSNGTQLNWTKLVFATGSSARALPEAIGGRLNRVYMLRDLRDADAMALELVEGRKVVIVGGGYIGLEAAAVCAQRGLEVTLVEAAERILQRVACEETSNWFRNRHASEGVKIIENTGLASINDENGIATGVTLTDGTSLEADFVLVGIGIIPNAELAMDCGLEVDGGIMVNEFCQTNDPDIYAAGDCAAFQYRGQLTRLESVQNAIDQAECVADNIAEQSRAYHPYPWFWSDQYDAKLQIAGLCRGYNNIVARPGEREGALSHFYFNGDQLLAVDAINDPRTYMVAKKMLESGKNITPEQAADSELQLKSLM